MKGSPFGKGAGRKNKVAHPKEPSSHPPRIWQRLGLLGVCLFFSLGLIFQVHIKDFPWLPVNMHSVLAADYSAEERAQRIPPVQFKLVRDSIYDQTFEKGPPDILPPDRYATLVSELQTPVATITPLYPVPTQNRTSTPTASPTPPATATSSPTATETPTSTNTATALPNNATQIPTQPVKTDVPRPTKTKKPPTQPPPTQPPPTKPPPTATRIPPTNPPPPPPNPYPNPTSPPYP